MSHFLTRQKTRRKKTTRLSALRRAFPFGRGMNRNSPARRAQTTIRSFRAFASPPNSPDRARPGGTTCESMNAAPALESRVGTDVQVYQRTQLPNLTPLSPFSPSPFPSCPIAGPRKAGRDYARFRAETQSVRSYIHPPVASHRRWPLRRSAFRGAGKRRVPSFTFTADWRHVSAGKFFLSETSKRCAGRRVQALREVEFEEFQRSGRPPSPIFGRP
jgi:hypothetical protein